jgi:hypothetical protein
MTIFVDVLKKLIRESLTTVSGDLYTKIHSKGYNHDLSREQHETISKLEEAIITFVSTHNDEADAASFAQLVTATRDAIKEIRERHRQAKDSGTTIPSLEKLIIRIPEFYDKLVKFKSKFNFIDKEHKKTPESIVYFYACCYLGDDIFNPKATTQVELRTQKETKLAVRLTTLMELIKPIYTLMERKARTLSSLDDIASDNLAVGKGSAPSLPTVSIFGFFQLGSPAEWFAPSTGRLGELIEVARAEIEKLSPETCDCPRDEVLAVAAVKPTVGAKPRAKEQSREEYAPEEEHEVLAVAAVKPTVGTKPKAKEQSREEYAREEEDYEEEVDEHSAASNAL